MNKQFPIVILLVILLAQPLIAGIVVPTSTVNTDSHLILAQDAGYRLDSASLTPHVPIKISRNADFVTQGWPGAGTPGSPYVIAGLNITEDLGMNLIQIENVSASFVIRDCALSQRTSATDAWAVYISNTTAATIEYSTVETSSGGVFCFLANNTVLDHNMISHSMISASVGLTTVAIVLEGSFDCSVQWNDIVTQFAGIYSIWGDNLVLNDNLFECGSAYPVYTMFLYNSTSITDDTVISGGLSEFLLCDSLAITNMHNTGSGGIEVAAGTHVEINSCYFDNDENSSVYVVASSNVDITDCYMSSPNYMGADIDSSENITFHDNIIENTEFFGLSIGRSENASIVGNTENNIGVCGYYVYNSNFTTISDSSVTCGQSIFGYSMGAWINTCINGSITGSSFSNSAPYGIYLMDANNWTITDNTIENATTGGGMPGWGIYLESGASPVITGNTVRQASNGIYVMSTMNTSVTDNHLTDVPGTGMEIVNSFYAEVLRNAIDGAYDGIYFEGYYNATVADNTLAKVMHNGLELSNGYYALVKSNAITGGPFFGIYTSGTQANEYIDNTLDGCGFYFDTNVIAEFYNTFDGNTVNGLPVYYDPDVSGVDVVASDYGQVILVNNSQMDIHDGSMQRDTCPILAANISNCNFWNLDTSNNPYGMSFIYAQNTSINDITYHGLGSSEGGMVGIFSQYSTNMTITDSEITDCGASYEAAFEGSYLNLLTIKNNLFDGNIEGIEVYYGNDILISSNQILNTWDNAVYVQGPASSYIRVLNNEILNATYGVWTMQAGNWTIMGNQIMYCSFAGIYFANSQADYGNITLNKIENNYYGIYISGGTYETITNNSIMWNAQLGVYLSGSTGTEVYYNIIALNRGGNGYDSRGSGYYWDDNLSLGNWWDDYTPPGTYAVDSDTYDRYPMQFAPTTPIISQPEDIYYAENSVGNEITWYAFGSHLRNWQVTIDGKVWKTDAWNYNDIVVNIDGLSYGTHTVVITLWDVDQNSVQDTVIVHVYDGTPPTISSTPNTEAFVTGSGQTLSWKVSDLHPATYTAYLDGKEWKNGTWSTGTLKINIDGMTAGNHTLVMTVFDIDGNQVSDSVTILVINDQVSPTVSSPADFSYYAGTTGNVIVWNASDQYPSHYEVTYNGTAYAKGVWAGGRIIVNVDGFAPGNYTFQITVYDGASNSAQDSVTVTVLGVTTQPQPPAPLDIGTIFLIAGVAGAAVVVIAVGYFLKKRT